VTAERAWERATYIALCIAGVLLLVLLVSGLALTFNYRPRITGYGEVRVLKSGDAILSARNIHRWSARLFIFAGTFLGIASFALFIVRKRWIALSLPFFGGFLAVIAFVTGLLLPWDELALTRVTVGSNIKGYTDILGNGDIKYVIVGRTEIEPGAFIAWFWTHIGSTVAIVAVVLLTMLVARRSEQTVGSEVRAEAERAELLPHD
jgi:quinol-cytochrome oxidoreductase complex cytochrome b subunit